MAIDKKYGKDSNQVRLNINSALKYNGIIVFICTDAWAPICIFLYVSGQNESVQLKPIGSLHVGPYSYSIAGLTVFISASEFQMSILLAFLAYMHFTL